MRLDLHSNNIGHAGINVIANSLANNASLRELRVEDARGWDAFSMTIGGSLAQTINDTYMSHNTLWMITPGLPGDLISKLHTNVYKFLQLNRNCDKMFVARAKIFKNHFEGDFDLRLFQTMHANLLPQVLGWVGGDCAIEEEERDVCSDTIGSENVVDHEMGSDNDESGKAVDSDGGDDRWQDWWCDHSPLSYSYGVGSYDHYRRANISPPRPEFNRLSIIYHIVRR
jgi:hypothetical protein